MDRYRIAPARPVRLSAAATGPGGAHLRPAALSSGRRSGGAEIGIFTAERYFSAADVVRRDAAPAPVSDHELPRVPVPAPDAASLSGRTAASSEASWNSRSGLLSVAHLSAAARQQKAAGAGAAAYGSDQGCQRGRKTGGGSGQRWTLFGRDCPCAGRKAVTVDVASEPRSPAPAAAHFNDARFSPPSAVEECLESDIFKAKHPSPPRAAADDHHQELASKLKVTVTPGSRAFPLAADGVFAAAPSRPLAAFKAEIDRRVVTSGGFTFPTALGAGRVVCSGSVLDEPPRVSLEVFHPIDEDSVMLADPPRAMPPAGRAGLLPLPARAPPLVPALADEEAMSDASSDLFDLESFAASSSYPTTYRGRGSRRNSADDDLIPYGSAAAAAEPALSECLYPASEVSVVWSVVTAEDGAFDAANFSSAASACCGDDLRYVVPELPEAGFTAAMSRSAGRKKSSGGGGFLNSCRCEKAVSVGPTPVRVVRPPAHPGAAARKMGGDGAARYHSGRGRAHVPVRT
ncbi:protein PHYTOCHROME KINASE SUBSTRATE 4-like [Panicum virgatum]|uniref:Protein PHYTOCHROME KINASE SUBSTRATE 4 n=1 Tax=Panicum virgatum TaxID=38727 RepID=A0A8T0SHY1_PANVG|nr:protein PHYTOCHROME KINASE SUBSTRATE 4-like [Panicum virgatum]KAG2596618.1 hypothetical protein PVAP13_5KG173200 [Panicum virgatum]